MSRQDNTDAMEDMLASIRQAIHQESAHQVAGLHAAGSGAGHAGAPGARAPRQQASPAPANDFAPPATAGGADDLRSLAGDDSDTDWSAPLHPARNNHEAESWRSGESAGQGDGLPDEGAPAASSVKPARRSEKRIRRVIGGIMSGQTGLDEALERLGEEHAQAGSSYETPFADSAFEDATMREPVDDSGSWWPDSDNFIQSGEQARHAPEEGLLADAAEDYPAPVTPEDAAPLLSPQSERAARDAFALLRQQLGGPAAIQRMARDMLRPMLREWLDENLPPLVEQMVREEIRRIARGGLKD